mmetsp:Transcript_21067/g.65940  ORF Transcript_21067/g.65940 Transcript_21067/m.65940 type:complete len:216 (-) Transcript_21067:442-1089(-)
MRPLNSSSSCSPIRSPPSTLTAAQSRPSSSAPPAACARFGIATRARARLISSRASADASTQMSPSASSRASTRCGGSGRRQRRSSMRPLRTRAMKAACSCSPAAARRCRWASAACQPPRAGCLLSLCRSAWARCRTLSRRTRQQQPASGRRSSGRGRVSSAWWTPAGRTCAPTRRYAAGCWPCPALRTSLSSASRSGGSRWRSSSRWWTRRSTSC